MLNERVPDKIVVFYDKQSEEFLIRLIDENWNDILKYDTLPAFCKLSDFYVDIIKVEEHEIIHHMVDQEILLINDLYEFSRSTDGSVKVRSKGRTATTKTNLKLLFKIKV